MPIIEYLGVIGSTGKFYPLIYSNSSHLTPITKKRISERSYNNNLDR